MVFFLPSLKTFSSAIFRTSRLYGSLVSVVFACVPNFENLISVLQPLMPSLSKDVGLGKVNIVSSFCGSSALLISMFSGKSRVYIRQDIMCWHPTSESECHEGFSEVYLNYLSDLARVIFSAPEVGEYLWIESEQVLCSRVSWQHKIDGF